MSLTKIKYEFNVSKVRLNTDRGENNGRDFIFYKEKEVKIDNASKTCTFGVLIVPMADPTDYGAKRHHCCLMGTKLYLKLPKMPWALLNTNAVYYDETLYNSTGHSALSARLKNQASGTTPNEAALVDIIEIETGMDISNVWGNETVNKVDGTVISPPKDPMFVDHIDQVAHKLKANLKQVSTFMVPGDSLSKMIPVYGIQYRFVINETIEDIRPAVKDVADPLTDLERLYKDMRFIQDDNGV